MPLNGTDDFASAAARHQTDAWILLQSSRPDNAVHLAGFAAECALKADLQRSLGAVAARAYGHDLDRLSGRAAAWTAAVVGSPRFAHAVKRLKGTDLAHRHPNRRYWATTWPGQTAKGVVEQSALLVTRLVIDDHLDRGHPFSED